MYKVYRDSTLRSMTKEEIIGQLRCAEHNWQVAEVGRDVLSKRLAQLTSKLIESGAYTTKQINEMMALREYGETL